MKQQIKKAAFITALIATIIEGLAIIPLAWMIPFTIKIKKAADNDEHLSVLFLVFYALLSCDPITTTLLVLSEDKETRYQYLFINAIISCVTAGSLLIPLAWMIPLTIKMYKATQGEKLTPTIRVLWFIFMSTIYGAVLLIEDEAAPEVVEAK